MTEKEKFVGKVIAFRGGRLSFARIHKAEARKGKDGKPKEGAKAKFSAHVLLDPSNKDHAGTIAEIKAESVRALNHRFGTPQNPQPFTIQMLEQVPLPWANTYLAWGYGSDNPKRGQKIYDGYADMFFLKMADEKRPNLLNRQGVAVVEGDKECPYAGCYVAGATTLYSYKNESRGVGANLRTLVFQGDGPAFGNGGANAEQDFAAIGDLGNEVPAGGGGGKDPFDI